MSSRRSVAGLCADILAGAVPDRDDLQTLLEAGDEAPLVYAAAREMRARATGDAVFLYGFVYFSTYCRNACAFCFYRAGNDACPRYRKTADEVVAICRDLAVSGVVLLDLTMGEDPLLHDDPARLSELVAAVVDATRTPVMVSPGVLPEPVLRDLRGAGADWYALYQETHTRELYDRLRVGQPFEERAEARAAARRAGLLVEDGLLTGIGDTTADRASSIVAMREAGWEQVRVMTFVPQAGTPLEHVPPAGDAGELLTIACLRLAMPERFIPASLDVDGITGLERRLQAGANVVTSIVPPTVGLAGVSQAELDIDEGYRTVHGVLPHLERLGLRPAGVDEYRARMDSVRSIAVR
ncbi:MAG TPA: methylornithine synthase PylB [Thermoleophilia bacterium]|nr:methylornithine synthase PylB [Thermoleophilia bacterium]